jgi:hypothetical protein
LPSTIFPGKAAAVKCFVPDQFQMYNFLTWKPMRDQKELIISAHNKNMLITFENRRKLFEKGFYTLNIIVGPGCVKQPGKFE